MFMTTVCQYDKEFENPIPSDTNQAMDELKMAHCIRVTHGEKELIQVESRKIDVAHARHLLLNMPENITPANAS